MIYLSKIFEELKLDQLEFVNFCILAGCDFNDNIPQIGVMKGFALIEKYITIENIKKAIGKSPKNYERSIEIFTILEEGLIEKAKNE